MTVLSTRKRKKYEKSHTSISVSKQTLELIDSLRFSDESNGAVVLRALHKLKKYHGVEWVKK